MPRVTFPLGSFAIYASVVFASPFFVRTSEPELPSFVITTVDAIVLPFQPGVVTTVYPPVLSIATLIHCFFCGLYVVYVSVRSVNLRYLSNGGAVSCEIMYAPLRPIVVVDVSDRLLPRTI